MGDEAPSADFMHQLREFSSPFRLAYAPADVVHKSF